jgi:uncharacterized glyoxalase superfamily protein PhnB
MGNSTIIPSICYRDAPAMIDWLCRAFGFAKKAVYPGPDGTIAHSELTFGSGMVMVASVPAEGPFADLLRQPGDIGGRETQTPCLIASDCDAVYAAAKAAGARMIRDIADMPYGGRAFTCADPEGHIWNVGSYDPWG